MELFVLTLEKTKEFVKTNCSLKANFIVSTTKKKLFVGQDPSKSASERENEMIEAGKKKVVS